MLYLACTTISSVDLAQCGVSPAKDWVSVKCGTNVYRDKADEWVSQPTVKILKIGTP